MNISLLFIRPILLLILSITLALMVTVVFPAQLSAMVSGISGTEQSISFPVQFRLLFSFFVIIGPLSLLISRLLLILRWQRGDVPSCPLCRLPMVRRTAKRGRYYGQDFWGCITYPRCKGKIHIG